MENFRFARVFRSRMILQQNAETEVWGFGARGKVIVELSGKESRRGGRCVPRKIAGGRGRRRTVRFARGLRRRRDRRR